MKKRFNQYQANHNSSSHGGGSKGFAGLIQVAILVAFLMLAVWLWATYIKN